MLGGAGHRVTLGIKLMGKTIVITGGGSGLGRALARCLAPEGHTLILLGRTLSKVEAVVREMGGSSFALACDVADPQSVDAAFAAIAKRHPQIDVLVNNAGLFKPFFVKDATNAQIEAAMGTNLTGPIYCSRAAIPMLGRGGHIINVSSEVVVIPIAMMALYQSTKAGLERFSRTLSQELAPDGIRVTIARAGKMVDADSGWDDVDPAVMRRFGEENLKIGFDSRKSAISHFDSAAAVIKLLLSLPDDINVPEIMLEARHK
jgi:meso-butanediol dehydrogenase/(S,S)-butanediol dehydrogenase/diacetyl reductase